MKKGSTKGVKKPIKKKTDDIVVVSLKDCFSCIAAKNLLDSKKKKFKNIQYEMSDTESKNMWNKFILDNFKKEHKTFPKIFINGKFIGGFNDLQKSFNK
jgi:glutaredoxin